MTYVTSIRAQSITDFLEENKDMEVHVEVPSLMDAIDEEHILKSMANQNYHFDVFVSYENTINNNPVYRFVLVIDDALTKTEYELMR